MMNFQQHNPLHVETVKMCRSDDAENQQIIKAQVGLSYQKPNEEDKKRGMEIGLKGSFLA